MKVCLCLSRRSLHGYKFQAPEKNGRLDAGILLLITEKSEIRLHCKKNKLFNTENCRFAPKFDVVVAVVSLNTKIIVPCAIIEHQGRILATQRNALGSLPLKWEFPGGKTEEGETLTEALLREIMEELSVKIHIGKQLPTSSRHYEGREILLIPFLCKLAPKQKILLTEHEQMVWLFPYELQTLDWAEADLDVIKNYLDYLKEV